MTKPQGNHLKLKYYVHLLGRSPSKRTRRFLAAATAQTHLRVSLGGLCEANFRVSTKIRVGPLKAMLVGVTR